MNPQIDVPLIDQLDFIDDRPLIEVLIFVPNGEYVPNYGSDPSPKEIRRRCLAIQEGWDETTERQRRTGSGDEVPFVIPIVRITETEFDNHQVMRLT